MAEYFENGLWCGVPAFALFIILDKDLPYLTSCSEIKGGHLRITVIMVSSQM